MSIIRDRVKQTATVTSFSGGIYVLAMDAGVAPAGYRTFRDGYEVPTVAVMGSQCSADIPVVVQYNGSNNWLAAIARYVRDNTGLIGVTTLTIDTASKGYQSLNLGAGIPVASTVDVFVAPISVDLGSISVGFEAFNTYTNAGEQLYFGGPLGASSGGNAGTLKGAVAIGDGSAAHGSLGIAIGAGTNAGGMYSVAIGHRATSSQPYSVKIGALGGPWYAATFETAHNKPTLTAGFAVESWQSNLDGFRQQKTTNATPANLNIYVPEAIDTLLPGTGWDEIYIEPGVTYFEAMVSAYNTATEEAKAWTLKFAVRNIFAYGGIAFLGSVTKTVIGSDANTASWDINPVLGTDFFVFEATGEAAKNIIWHCTFNAKIHAIYN